MDTTHSQALSIKQEGFTRQNAWEQEHPMGTKSFSLMTTILA